MVVITSYLQYLNIMAWNLFSVITNNTDQMLINDPRILETLGAGNLWDDESITFAFCYVRDMVIFTSHRMIVIDVQKLRGKKIRKTFYPWYHMESFSVENCGGTFDGDHDVEIKFKGHEEPYEFQIKKKYDLSPITRFLSYAQRQSI
jgi:Bacterial PH domain